MPTATAENRFEEVAPSLIEEIAAGLQGMEQIAATVRGERDAERLHKIGELLRSHNFRIAVAGGFDSGKSTLTLALLGPENQEIPAFAEKLVDVGGQDQLDAVSLAAIRSADAVVNVINNDAIQYQETECGTPSRHAEDAGKRLTVINLPGRYKPDERFCRSAWNSLVYAGGRGPEFSESDQNFAAQRIFFVDCEKALQGRAMQDEAMVRESGLPGLERALRALHFRDWQAHVTGRCLPEALRIGEEMWQHIGLIRVRTEQDTERDAEILESLRSSREALCQCCAGFAPLVESYEQKAAAALKLGCAQMIAQLRLDLKTALLDRTLPSENRLAAMFFPRKIAEEASDACDDIVNRRQWEWQQPGFLQGMHQILSSPLEELGEKIKAKSREITELEEEWTLNIVVADPILASPGPEDKYVVSGVWEPVFRLKITTSSFPVTGLTTVERIKQSVLCQADEQLSQATEVLASHIEQAVSRFFENVQHNISRAVDSYLEEPLQAIQARQGVIDSDRQLRLEYLDRLAQIEHLLRNCLNEITFLSHKAETL